MAVRCDYCRSLIIHRFNGRYTRRDRKAKARHQRMCRSNPEVAKRRLKTEVPRGVANAQELERRIDERAETISGWLTGDGGFLKVADVGGDPE